MAKTRQRIPKLRFTTWRDLGWHVAFRDKETRIPRKHLFNIHEREREAEARVLYHGWVLEHLGANGKTYPIQIKRPPRPTKRPEMLSGCVLEVATGLKKAEQARVREAGEPRRTGSIAAPVFRDRVKVIHDFLEFLNERHGTNAITRLRLSDLSMQDIEEFNRAVVRKGFSASQVAKRLQIVKAIIDRAGRPEHGQQVLTWNWDSRDVVHGKPSEERTLPTVDQLKRMLQGTDLRGRTMIWLGIGLGLGAKDLSAIHVGQISAKAYDLRRPKTGVERYGETPPLVWAYVKKYQEAARREAGQTLFVTRNGVPLVTPTSNAVTLWWDKLRTKVGEKKETLDGFYTLRHLGATEFGSRPGCSIGDIKRWLGHAASSDMADLYMRPVRPELREVIEWVRKRLASGSTAPDSPPKTKPTQATS
ncbi:MAG: site-specific integrase [Phycisphaerales bacterium]|nr:site-specific integrase [Phycisphaerales bacterium]